MGYQTITDGHYYRPESVIRLKQNNKKPSLEILSDLSTLKQYASVEMGNYRWSDLFRGQKIYDDYENIGGLRIIMILAGIRITFLLRFSFIRNYLFSKSKTAFKIIYRSIRIIFYLLKKALNAINIYL